MRGEMSQPITFTPRRARKTASMPGSATQFENTLPGMKSALKTLPYDLPANHSDGGAAEFLLVGFSGFIPVKFRGTQQSGVAVRQRTRIARDGHADQISDEETWICHTAVTALSFSPPPQRDDKVLTVRPRSN